MVLVAANPKSSKSTIELKMLGLTQLLRDSSDVISFEIHKYNA